jgi:hypothetical protein
MKKEKQLIANLTNSNEINDSLYEIGVRNIGHGYVNAMLTQLANPEIYPRISHVKKVVKQIVESLTGPNNPRITGIMLSPNMDNVGVAAPYLFRQLKMNNIKVWFKLTNSPEEIILINAPN